MEAQISSSEFNGDWKSSPKTEKVGLLDKIREKSAAFYLARRLDTLTKGRTPDAVEPNTLPPEGEDITDNGPIESFNLPGGVTLKKNTILYTDGGKRTWYSLSVPSRELPGQLDSMQVQTLTDKTLLGHRRANGSIVTSKAMPGISSATPPSTEQHSGAPAISTAKNLLIDAQHRISVAATTPAPVPSA